MIQRVGFQLIRGFMMGAADIVPGVSGGTVALILGIYKTLINNVRAGAHGLKQLLTGDFGGGIESIKNIDWLFILPLGTGIVAAFAILRHWMEDLLIDHGEGLAAVFCGLVAASCWLVWTTMTNRDTTRLATIGGVAIVTFGVLGLQAGVVSEPSLIFFLLTGMVAICAMILPGISGSFIMLILGMYWAVLVEGTPVQLAVFAVGAVIGLALFSPPLNFLLENHEQTVMAALLGLMLGSYRLLWPWPNGVGDFGETAEDFVSGTNVMLPDSASAFAGGVGLAVAAAVATLTIVKLAEKAPSPEG